MNRQDRLTTSTAAEGVLPTAALFSGETWHGRRSPAQHSFTYPVWSLAVDLHHLPTLAQRLRLLGVDRRALTTLRSEDHLLPLDADGARSWLARRGVDLAGGRIRLLTTPRVLGAGFNPLSLWWCYSSDENLIAVVAEVHNTEGDRHAYVLRPDSKGRTEVDKIFHVSPFLPTSGQYRARVRATADRFVVHLGYEQDGRRIMDATWRGHRLPLSDWRLAAMVVRAPWAGLRVATLIRWQGFRLWLRRLQRYAPPPGGIRDTDPAGAQDQDPRTPTAVLGSEKTRP